MKASRVERLGRAELPAAAHSGRMRSNDRNGDVLPSV
jgi:hypothetical protein